jgi:hypothetical protein
MRPFIWSRVCGLMRFLTADQNQQRVNVCEELCQVASDVTILSRVIIVTRTGSTLMTPLRQSNNPPSGKIETLRE